MSSGSAINNSATSLADSLVHGQEPAPFEGVPTDVRAVNETHCSARVEQAIRHQRQDAFEREPRMAAEINDRRYRWFRAFWLSDAALEEIGEAFLKARTDQEFDAALDRAMHAAPGAAKSRVATLGSL